MIKNLSQKYRLVIALLILNLILSPLMVCAAVLVTPATGGEAISADTANNSWTTMSGLVVSETVSGDFKLGNFLFTAPAGFEFNESNQASVLIENLNENCDSSTSVEFNSFPAVIPSQTIYMGPINATNFRLIVSRPSSAGCLNKITINDISIRPTAGSPLVSDQISLSDENGFSGQGGLVNEVAGALSTIVVSPTVTSTISVGDSIDFSAQGSDQFNNIISGLVYTWTLSPTDTSNSLGADGKFLANAVATGLTVNAGVGSINGSSNSFNIKSSQKMITAFSFSTPSVQGVINEENKTIRVEVPAGTNVENLVPIIVVSNSATVNPVSGLAQNFSSPVIYTVAANDLSTLTYTVTVTVISSGGGSSGGGGGGIISTPTCLEVNYGDWQSCVNNTQLRNYTSTNPATCQKTAEQILAAKRACVVAEGTGTNKEIEAQVLSSKTYPDGSLLRNQTKIFVINGSKKRQIKTLAELAKFYKGRQIIKVEESHLNSYQTIDYPNGSLLRDSQKRIFVISNGERRHIKTLKELIKKYFALPIIDVSDDILPLWSQV